MNDISKKMIFIAVILTLMLIAVVVFDVTNFIIPNELNLGFLILYPAFLVLTPHHIDWWNSLLVMLAFFAVGYLVFMSGIIGGGDIKLFIVLSLWIGWQPIQLAQFGIWTALAGGILALALIIIRGGFILLRKIRGKSVKLPKVFRWSEPLPYGVAIAYAFGFLLWTGQVKGIQISL